MVDQKEEMEDEKLPMEEEHSGDKGEYADEDESVEGNFDEEVKWEEEEEYSEEYEDDPDKQGPSAAAAAMGIAKKCPFKKSQLPKFNNDGKIKIISN
jgi:hypothetical protein